MKCKNLTIKILIILFVFVPFVVNAKENCTVVSGTGNDIGSEIACGSEHFYVIDSDENNLRMLAKYNLGVGYTVNQIKLSQERWDELFAEHGYYSNGSPQFSYTVFGEPEFVDEYNFFGHAGVQTFDAENHVVYTDKNLYEDYRKIVVSEERYNELDAQYNFGSSGAIRDENALLSEPEFAGYTNILYISPKFHAFGASKENTAPVKQDSQAIGAHGTIPGSPEFPQIGIVESHYGLGFYNSSPKTETYRGGYNDFIIDQEALANNNYYLKYLNQYRDTLSNYEVTEYSFLTIGDLDNIVYKLTNQHLPLEDWLTGWQSTTGLLGDYNIMGNFKQYLPEGYEWLYSTSYWTRSGIGEIETERYEIFIDTLGNVCNDDYCSSAVGAGVRPVVTIAREKVIYNITVESNDNGTVEVVRSSEAGKNVSFILRSREGFKLGSLVLKDDDGNTIEFTEISTDEEGNIIVSTNEFTMPLNNVRIIVNWVSDNQEEPTPDTPTDDPNEGNNTEPMNGEISTDEKVPITGDNILKSLSLLGISILVLSSVILVGKKNNKKKRLVIE